MKKIIAIFVCIFLLLSFSGCFRLPADGKTPYIQNGYWHIDGVNTGVKAQGVDGINGTNGNDGVDGANGKNGEDGKTPYIQDGYWYIDGVNTGVKAEATDSTAKTDPKEIGTHYMINNGLIDMAANAVEFIVDDTTGIVYAAYLASETTLGESSSLVKLAKFNILQPTNVEWITVFDKSTDFGGSNLSECNIIDLNSSTVRVFAVNTSTWTYYYKDINKKTLAVSAMEVVKFKSNQNADAISLSKANLNQFIASIGGVLFSDVQSTTKILKVNGYYYTTVVGGNRTQNILFMKSVDGAIWEFQSVIHHTANYEAMLEYHNGKFWVMCRDGSQTTTSNKYQNLMYSEDGINWTQSNLALTTSDTRPYLFTYQGDLYLAYSSPMSSDYSTVRTWRCNIHIGKIVSANGTETFEEVIYKESKFGIVYYALCDWYGNMIMLYSSGELNPTEGLMNGWSQGKDCVNYTIVHQQSPKLSLRSLNSISITSQPTTTEYIVGDSFDSKGLRVSASYSDGTHANIAAYSLSIPDMTTPGTMTVTVTYTENNVTKTASFDITIFKEATSIYTPLKSIRSNGSQYIDTGYPTTENTKIVVTMEKPENSGVEGGKWLFNSTNASVCHNYGFCIKPDGMYVLDYGGVRYNQGKINWADGKNIITIGNGEFTINGGELISGLNVTTFPSNSLGTLRFFTSASTGSNVYLSATVYDIAVFEGEVLVMHLIPVQRNKDGKIGFYDSVNRKFISSATLSDFEIGH